MNFIAQAIASRIDTLRRDIARLDADMKRLIIENAENPAYSSPAIAHAITAAMQSSKEYLQKGISLHESALDGTFTEDAAMWFDNYRIDRLPATVNAIISARVDIIRFHKSRFSVKHYRREAAAVEACAKSTRSVSLCVPVISIPEQPENTLKRLSYELRHQAFEVDGKASAMTETAIVAIVAIVGDRKKMPKKWKNAKIKGGWL